MTHEVEIVRDSLKVFEHSVTPAIQLKIRYTLSLDKFPVNMNGSVYSEDKKFISVLTELPPVDMWNNNRPGHEQPRSSILLRLGAESNGTTLYEHDMIFTLDKKTLDYLEDRRYSTKNHDVLFRFHLTLTTLGTTIRAGLFKSDSLEQDKRAVIVSPSNQAESDLDFNILASSHSSKFQDKLLLSEVFNENISITIPSSDWVNDFQEKLDLGKFMVVEIPQLATDLKGIDNTSLDPDQVQLKERLVRALENLEDIKENIMKAEWKKAAEGCRATIEPFTKGNVPRLIREIIIQDTGIEEKDANQLIEAFKNLFGYSSGLLHEVRPNQKLSNRYSGGKEDAYMNYMILAAIVNSVARKFIETLNKT